MKLFFVSDSFKELLNAMNLIQHKRGHVIILWIIYNKGDDKSRD